MRRFNIDGKAVHYVQDIAYTALRVPNDKFQRKAKDTHVNGIVGEYNPNAKGIIFVGKLIADTSGIHFIIDGQHRFLAEGEYIGPKKQATHTMTCEVIEVETMEQMAALFHLRNTTYRITKNQSFRAELFAGEDPAIIIARIAKEYEITLYDAEGPNKAHGGPFKAVYKYLGGKPKRFREFLDLLTIYVGEDGAMERKALQSKFLDGLATYYTESELPFAEIKVALTAAKHNGASAADCCDYTSKNSKENGVKSRREAVAKWLRARIREVKVSA